MNRVNFRNDYGHEDSTVKITTMTPKNGKNYYYYSRRPRAEAIKCVPRVLPEEDGEVWA